MITARTASAPAGSSAQMDSTSALVAAQPQSSSATRTQEGQADPHQDQLDHAVRQDHVGRSALLAALVTVPAVLAMVVRFRQNRATTAPR